MKKRLLSVALAVSMTAAMLTGCGSGSSDEANSSAQAVSYTHLTLPTKA